VKPTELQVESLSSPLGLDACCPAFRWRVETSRRGWGQSAYRVVVARTPQALADESPLLWDSGKTADSSSRAVPPSLPLASAQSYWWKVRVWDDAHEPSDWSEPARFGTGVLRPEEWQARWIGAGPIHEARYDLQRFAAEPAVMTALIPDDAIDLRSVLLRRSLNLPERPAAARVFVTGLGFYELYLNGRKVGDHVLAPSRTNYLTSVLYDAFDVTDLLGSGQNVLGIMLGNGWYNPPKEHWNWRMQWHGSPRGILQCHIEYADGRREVVASDGSWKTHSGPITFSCIYGGEEYDARLEQAGWAEAGFDDSSWGSANEVEPPGGRLAYHALPPIRVTEHVRPIAMTQPKPGMVVYDMGQNFAGWVRLRVRGPRGTAVALRFAENVKPDGTLNNSTSKDARQSDTYILRGDGREEVYEPRFTYHGFQYVEMTGYPGLPDLDTIEGCVIRSACRQLGSFQCGHETIDHIHRCTVWSQKSNMPGLPTDDCQRAERLGWLADAHVGFAEAVCNFEMDSFYRKYLRDLAQAQYPSGEMPLIAPYPLDKGDNGVCWGSAYPLIAWYHYQNFGDARVLREHLDGLRRYVDWMVGQADNLIAPPDPLGDWNSSIPGFKQGQPELASTWYLYYDSLIVSQAAGVLGLEDLHRQYRQLAEQVRDAFNRRFLDAKTGQYGEGTQCEQVMPLYLDMVPPEQLKLAQQRLLIALEFLSDGHIAVGILGARYILEYLDRIGRSDMAWRAVTKTSFPSWGRLCQGRTTLGECWNGWGTKNHVMLGVVDAWFHWALGGIRVDESASGADRLVLQPFFAPGLDHCRCVRPTVRGQVWSHWQREGRELSWCKPDEWSDHFDPSRWQRENRGIRWSIGIPAGNKARVTLALPPGGTLHEGGTLLWDGRPAKDAPGVDEVADLGDGRVQLVLGSGQYDLRFPT
jgi:alpha-L-rhamnosidase